MADIKVKLTYDEKKVIIMGLIELKNKLIEETTREALIERGYDPCGNCHP